MSKSVGKRHQSTRKLSQRLKSEGYQIGKSTVHRFLKDTKQLKAYKRQKQPKLTERQKQNRLKFCKEKENWTADDWNNVMWSDESPFELMHASNVQNDRVWASDSTNVPPNETVKNPPKVMVWGMMSCQALSDLHFIPPKQTVNAAYYVDNILSKTCLDAVNRKAKRGTVLKKAMAKKKV